MTTEIDWRSVVDRASAVAVGAGAPDDATLPEQVEWLAHKLHGPSLHPAAVVTDTLSLLSDDDRALLGISARPLRQVVKLLEAMDAATAGEPIRGALGDHGADFGGTVEVITGEHDGTQVIDGEKLIGWVVRTESWWEFVPCVPQLWWSREQEGWVGHTAIYAENRKRAALPEDPRAED